MRLFYIDTSSNWLLTGIYEDNKILAEVKIKLGSLMSKSALEKVAEVFRKSSIEPTDIDKIIVVSGPGSYTGIRIGMTIAKIYAYTFKKEITTITSLEAMNLSEDSKETYAVSLIDARRGFVYAGIYKDNEIIFKNQYIKLDKLLDYIKTLHAKVTFITDQEYTKTLEEILIEKEFAETNKNYSVIEYTKNLLNIASKTKDKKEINPHLVEPTYLKLTEAEENLRNIHYDN